MRKKLYNCNFSQREEREYTRETTEQAPRSVKKEGGEGSAGAHGEDRGDANCPLAAHGG